MSEVKIPGGAIKLIAGGIPIVVAVDANPVVPGQVLEIVVTLNTSPVSAVAVTLSCDPPELDGMGSFNQRQQSQTYSAIVKKGAGSPFIITATTPSGSLSSESNIILSCDPVIGS